MQIKVIYINKNESDPEFGLGLVKFDRDIALDEEVQNGSELVIWQHAFDEKPYSANCVVVPFGIDRSVFKDTSVRISVSILVFYNYMLFRNGGTDKKTSFTRACKTIANEREVSVPTILDMVTRQLGLKSAGTQLLFESAYATGDLRELKELLKSHMAKSTKAADLNVIQNYLDDLYKLVNGV